MEASAGTKVNTKGAPAAGSGASSPGVSVKSMSAAAQEKKDNTKPAAAARPAVTGSSKNTAAITVTEEQQFKDALKAVKTDKSETDWVLLSYTAKDTLSLVGSGGGGVTALSDKLDEENCCFGLVRVTELIDKSVTTKFVFIKFQPETMNGMKKAQIGVKDGTIKGLFQPFHVDFQIQSKKEISEEIVKDKVASASGTKNNTIKRD